MTAYRGDVPCLDQFRKVLACVNMDVLTVMERLDAVTGMDPVQIHKQGMVSCFRVAAMMKLLMEDTDLTELADKFNALSKMPKFEELAVLSTAAGSGDVAMPYPMRRLPHHERRVLARLGEVTQADWLQPLFLQTPPKRKLWSLENARGLFIVATFFPTTSFGCLHSRRAE